MNTVVAALHEATHRVPGVPAHTDQPANQEHRVNARHHTQSRRLRDHSRRRQAPPRILVGWQSWIGRLVGRRDS
jgi:hypothetical protein